MRRLPVNRVLVEEGPRRNNGDEGKSGTAEKDPQGKGDVLGGVADDKGDNLGGVREKFRIAVKARAYAGGSEQRGGQELRKTLAIEVLGTSQRGRRKCDVAQRTIWPSTRSRAFSSNSSAMAGAFGLESSSRAMMKLKLRRRCSGRNAKAACGPARVKRNK